MHSITKEIRIDAAHRVPLHGSKCKNLHGHSYDIIMEITGDLFQEGPQSNMVLDFSFMKDLMMQHIDATCDHGIILASDDHKFLEFAALAADAEFETYENWHAHITSSIDYDGFWSGITEYGKTYIIHGAPTAENLSQHWFRVLAPEVLKATNGQAQLTALTVKETPTSIATFRP